jgi:hypothetical protein
MPLSVVRTVANFRFSLITAGQKSQKPKAKSQKPKAKSQKPKAKSPLRFP